MQIFGFSWNRASESVSKWFQKEQIRSIHSGWSSMSLFRPWWVEPEMPPLGPEDEDVARERERVINGKAQSDILTMIDLSKVQPGCRLKNCKLFFASLNAANLFLQITKTLVFKSYIMYFYYCIRITENQWVSQNLVALPQRVTVFSHNEERSSSTDPTLADILLWPHHCDFLDDHETKNVLFCRFIRQAGSLQ